MSLRQHPLTAACPLLLVLLLASHVSGQGRIILDPPPDDPQPGPQRTPIHLASLVITAEITEGVAVTEVAQTFRNQLNRQTEGTYIFPLPVECAVGDFSMTVNGKTLHGEVLDATQARQTYLEIVRRTQDPGLLEFVGGRLFRARVFPIPANGTVETKLSFTQTLTEQSGLGLFTFPLRSDPQTVQSLQRVALHATISSTQPLLSVFSTSHECEVLRPSAHKATVSYESSHTQLDRDFTLYYQRDDSDFGLALLTHREAAEDGTFLLRLTPGVELSDEDIQPKDIVFVVDTSGSMKGEKIAQTRRALQYCIESLNPDDRFNIYGFSTEARPFRDGLVPATDEVRDAALAYTEALQAAGGTNINQALLAALTDDPRSDQRPYLVVFMTDGLPTIEVRDPEQILNNVAAANSRNVRFHVLGVGSDVNTHLLDKLAAGSRGTRDYCTENEELEIKLSNFVTRLAHPVLTDVELTIDGVDTYDIYPRELPDLFRGGELVVMGRYQTSGHAIIKLDGQMRDRRQRIIHETAFPHRDPSADFLPRLWAHRKVAYLLDELRLHGHNQELVNEVQRLATRYGIVTPYTSSLIVDENVALVPHDIDINVYAMNDHAHRRARTGGHAAAGQGMFGQGQQHQQDDYNAGGTQLGVAPRQTVAAPAVGRGAVDTSQQLRDWMESATLAEADGIILGEQHRRYVGSRVFALVNSRWTDLAWDGKQEPERVVTFSDRYFELLDQHPELKKIFALDQRVLVVLDDKVYETTPEIAREIDLPTTAPATQPTP